MEVSKSHIINGLHKYVKKDVLPKINDKSFKMVLSMGVNALAIDNTLLDGILHNPMVAAILKEKDGMYELDMFEDVVDDTLAEYGSIHLTIPGIPFLSPDEKHMNFTTEDIDKLIGYIEGSEK
jgi:hypothetical protein